MSESAVFTRYQDVLMKASFHRERVVKELAKEVSSYGSPSGRSNEQPIECIDEEKKYRARYDCYRWADAKRSP